MRFFPLPSSFKVCDALRMGSVGPSLERGAVVAGAEVCAAAEDEEGEAAVEGRMSLMRVGLGFAGMVGERGFVGRVGEGEQGPWVCMRWCVGFCEYGVYVEGFYVRGRQVQDRGIFS